MVLFEKDGMSFYNSVDMKHWERKSHFKGLFECPDFFELAVDGNNDNKKWVIHGGSSDYFIGSFDGKTFTPETEKLHYAEGRSERRGDILYAAESFENMPDNRRVQIAWGRVDHPGMPFTQMMLFPTEFTIKTTDSGLRLRATPIKEITQIKGAEHRFQNLALQQVNKQLNTIRQGPLHITLKFTIEPEHNVRLRYAGNEILNLSSRDCLPGDNEMEILIDKTVAEIFLNGGERYITKQLLPSGNEKSLEFDSENYGPTLTSLNVYEMKSIWISNK